MRDPRWKDATRSAEVSVYNALVEGEHGQGVDQTDGGTHDEQYGDGVVAAYGDDVRGVCVVAGTKDVDECAMVVSEVHSHNFRKCAARA